MLFSHISLFLVLIDVDFTKVFSASISSYSWNAGSFFGIWKKLLPSIKWPCISFKTNSFLYKNVKPNSKGKQVFVKIKKKVENYFVGRSAKLKFNRILLLAVVSVWSAKTKVFVSSWISFISITSATFWLIMLSLLPVSRRTVVFKLLVRADKQRFLYGDFDSAMKLRFEGFLFCSHFSARFFATQSFVEWPYFYGNHSTIWLSYWNYGWNGNPFDKV